jgi:hypothetical protein
LPINLKAISLSLGILVAICPIVSVAGQSMKYFKECVDLLDLITLVDICKELTLPSMFSTYLLFVAALLLGVITCLKRNEKGRHVFEWLFLTAGFLFMTFDEGASIHELVMYPVQRMLGGRAHGIFFYAWVIPGMLLVFFIFLLLFKFIRDLPPKTRRGFLISGAIYLFGAIGFELITGKIAEEIGVENFGINVLATVEEVLEMAGVTLFIQQLLSYIDEHYPNLWMVFSHQKQEA